MKYFLSIILTISGCIAQPFTFQDLAFLGQETNATASFSPSDVANLVMWYKADAIAGKSVGDGVTNWNDSSSSGYTLQNGAANQQPYYTNSSEINSKPWLKFDGSDDRLLHFNTTVYSQPNTIYMVLKIGIPVSAMQFCDGTNSGTRHVIEYYGTTPGWGYYAGTERTIAGSITNKFLLFEGTFNGASSSLLTNGVTAMSGSTVGTQPLSGFVVGCRYALTTFFLNGGVAEILVYNANVSSGDRTKLRTYFTDKYGAFSSW